MFDVIKSPSVSMVRRFYDKCTCLVVCLWFACGLFGRRKKTGSFELSYFLEKKSQICVIIIFGKKIKQTAIRVCLD